MRIWVDVMRGVTRFACPTSWPPLVTVESFLRAHDQPPATLLMFLHVLAAPNTTAEEEWEGYVACVRVMATLGGNVAQGLCCCIQCHHFDHTGVSVTNWSYNLDSSNYKKYFSRGFFCPRMMKTEKTLKAHRSQWLQRSPKRELINQFSSTGKMTEGCWKVRRQKTSQSWGHHAVLSFWTCDTFGHKKISWI